MKKQILAILILFAGHASGGGLDKGDIVTVKAGSLWFTTDTSLRVYQRLSKDREFSPEALARYQEAILQCREAWQFTGPLQAKVLFFNDPLDHQVYVQLIAPGGSKQGTAWYIDTEEIQSFSVQPSQ